MTAPRLGLAMRFRVVVDGLNLGNWASCKGLKLTCKPYTLRESGNVEYEEILPGELSYAPITLERAMDASSSKTVQNWLRSTYTSWLDEAAAEIFPGSTAQITLLDGAQQTVLTWSLRGVYPIAWTGPTLSAKDSAVAIEALELTHKGFL
ncbi:phage tail protein [Amycolatopsis sp. cg5]|uniref:phage tail protein n=1 Tax=Amycolatopsis sp. cg5 TaxID=3238802 RepID=UPI003526C241